MNETLYMPDDRALFSLIEHTDATQHVGLCGAMTRLVKDGALAFPPEVAADVEHRGDPAADARLLIWVQAIRPSMNCEASYAAKRQAQNWAVTNGYPEGLDAAAVGRRGTCLVAVVGRLLELRAANKHCVVITGDFTPKPSRVPLGEVCVKLSVPTITPLDFKAQVLDPLMNGHSGT